MFCIKCSSDTRVINSRPHKKTPSVWRRRSCKSCGLTFTTWETVAEDGFTLKVRNHSDSLESFSFPRLLVSIYSSLTHLDSHESADTAYWLAQTIAQNLQQGNTAEIKSDQVAMTAYEILAHYDATAGQHYAVRHRITSSRTRTGVKPGKIRSRKLI